jgi:hypothetical protein
MASQTLRALALVLLTGGSSQAAMITDINAAWPTPADVETINAISVTNANRGISGTRINRQSFRVTSDITIATIFLSAGSYGNNAFNISFWDTVNTNGNPLTPGAQVGSTITVPAFGSTASGVRNLAIALDISEQITLPAATSPAGYIMQIQLTDTASGAAFNWAHSNTGTDIYTLGRLRRDDGDQTNTRDYGLALVAVPEPASLSILACAGALMRRRRTS